MAEEKKTFRAQVPAIMASVGGSLSAFVIGNFFGIAGTITGLVLGSSLSGTAAFFFERETRRAAEFAKLRAQAMRSKGRPLSIHETQQIQAITDKPEKHFPVKPLAGFLAVVLLLGSVFLAFEWGVSRAAVAVVRTVSHNTPETPIPVTSGFRPVKHSPSATPDVSPSVTPDVTPSVSPSVSITPTVSPSYLPGPSYTPVPSYSPLPTATPTVVPTVTSSISTLGG